MPGGTTTDVITVGESRTSLRTLDAMPVSFFDRECREDYMINAPLRGLRVTNPAGSKIRGGIRRTEPKMSSPTCRGIPNFKNLIPADALKTT